MVEEVDVFSENSELIDDFEEASGDFHDLLELREGLGGVFEASEDHELPMVGLDSDIDWQVILLALDSCLFIKTVNVLFH